MRWMVGQCGGWWGSVVVGVLWGNVVVGECGVVDSGTVWWGGQCGGGGNVVDGGGSVVGASKKSKASNSLFSFLSVLQLLEDD